MTTKRVMGFVRRFGLIAHLLGAIAVGAAGSAAAQIVVGQDMSADDRVDGSGFFPGDAGYWIGGADGYVYVCWSDDRRGSAEWALFCRTYQGGKPIGGPVPVVQSFGPNVFFPQGCDSADGSLYLIWASSGRLNFSRSDDRGLSWTKPVRIDRGPSSLVPSVAPHLACYGSKAFVVWADSRDGDHRVYFTRSVDYGQTWPAADQRIDTLEGTVEGYHNGPFLTADSYGDVNVAWVKNNHLYFDFSWDAGDTWAPSEIQIDQLGIPDPDSSRPSMAADGLGDIYVAWTGSSGQMYLNRSADWGQTWLPQEQRISDNFSVIAVAGTITADNSGHVYGVWYYQAQGSFVFDVRFNTSSDYGVTWQESDTQLGTTGISVHPFTPTLASDNNGGVYAIWLRYLTPSNRHIYGNASFDYGSSWAGGEAGFQVDSAPESLDINPHQPFAGCDQGGTGAATWIDRRDSAQWHMQINTFRQSH